MRRGLDLAYAAAGWAAALSILAICLIVSAQVGLNVLARLGGPGWAFTIPSYADFAGYFLAAGTFLALASTLRHGVHIRVNLLVRVLPARLRWGFELATLAVAAAITGFATWYAAALVWESWSYGDTSSGMIAVPLWIPQIPMLAGLALLLVALLDTAAEALRRGEPVLIDAGEA